MDIRNHVKRYLFSLCVLFLFACNGQSKINIDSYVFYISPKYILGVAENDENVLLSLNDPIGNSIMIQNRLDFGKNSFFKNKSKEETLLLLHKLKFPGFIKALDGYDVEEVALLEIGEVLFSTQSFKYIEKSLGTDLEMIYDVRILLLEDNHYPLYAFDKVKSRDVNKKVADEIIESLSRENFEN